MNRSTSIARRIQRGHLVIASVYPGQLPTISRPFDGWTGYTLTPVEKGESPFLLKVEDAIQFERDPMVRENITETLIFADQIVDDLLVHWARTPNGAPAGSGPGVGLIAGETPTVAELKVLHERQNLLFEFYYQEGLRLAQNQEWRGIDHRHRMAALYLEREQPWAIDSEKSMEQFEECPACGSPMPAGKSICRSCGTIVRELPAELAALQPGARRKGA